METVPPQFLKYLNNALAKREEFFHQCYDEDSNCYRIFHGSVENWPSVTIDRYGDSLLFQTWRTELNDTIVAQMAELIENKLYQEFSVIWCDRRKRGQVERHIVGAEPPKELVGKELGLSFRVDPIHRGIDPLLFLDFRAGRRKIRQVANGKKLLNLFSYTSGIGVAAAAGGAKLALNVDFATHALAIGQANADLNGLGTKQFQIVREDAIAVLRQYSGLGIRGRARNRKYTKLSARLFDIVVLDPPRKAKSPFGIVDTVNDYQSLFKPALLCTKPNGQMLVTNNVASVEQESWLESLRRCARKADRDIVDVEMIAPEDDFPSIDGRHPLKMAWLTVS